MIARLTFVQIPDRISGSDSTCRANAAVYGKVYMLGGCAEIDGVPNRKKKICPAGVRKRVFRPKIDFFPYFWPQICHRTRLETKIHPFHQKYGDFRHPTLVFDHFQGSKIDFWGKTRFFSKFLVKI